jgi:hypothetical protein
MLAGKKEIPTDVQWDLWRQLLDSSKVEQKAAWTEAPKVTMMVDR